jgi:hypothetical protein
MESSRGGEIRLSLCWRLSPNQGGKNFHPDTLPKPTEPIKQCAIHLQIIRFCSTNTVRVSPGWKKKTLIYLTHSKTTKNPRPKTYLND